MGRGAVLKAILGPVAVNPPIQDFVGDIEIGSNAVENFNFEPLISGLEPSDLVGMEVKATSDATGETFNEEILPEGTIITAIKGDILILSNDFIEGGDNIQFRIVGDAPPPSAGITTFNVSVKNTPLIGEDAVESKFVIDDRLQREMCSDGYTLERGKTLSLIHI